MLENLNVSVDKTSPVERTQLWHAVADGLAFGAGVGQSLAMSTNPLARQGGVSYLEIPALEIERSAAFYEQVVGWKIERRQGGEARFADEAGLLIGRWVRGRAVAREPGMLLFVYVAGIDEAVAKVVPAGGEIVDAPYAEGDTKVARIRDPAGNMLGVWQFTDG
jgi:uncharacterized protein